MNQPSLETYKELPLQAFSQVADWEAWLQESHAQLQGVWLKFAKKGTGATTISYEEARNAAIAFGWIDGLTNRFDETYYLIRFTPRRAKSMWSKINRAVVESLIAAGKMQPAGLAQVEAAKKDGRWDLAYDSSSTMQVPDDFRQALDAHPAAAEHFASLKSANRYAFLYRIQTAKSPEVRAKKIASFIAMLEAGESLHPLL